MKRASRRPDRSQAERFDGLTSLGVREADPDIHGVCQRRGGFALGCPRFAERSGPGFRPARTWGLHLGISSVAGSRRRPSLDFLAAATSGGCGMADYTVVGDVSTIIVETLTDAFADLQPVPPVVELNELRKTSSQKPITQIHAVDQG
jgi:hypothetical protein